MELLKALGNFGTVRIMSLIRHYLLIEHISSLRKSWM
jgi:hypothetical protein